MLSELLQKLEIEHGIDPAKGQNVINTITQHIKEKFPSVGGMLDTALGNQTTAPIDNTGVPTNTDSESTLQKIEDFAKSKLGGIFRML